MNKILRFLVCFFTVPLALSATEFKYSLRNVGSIWPGKCNEKAFELSKSFESTTGLKVIRARCEEDSLLHEVTLTISYVAEKPINLVSTFPPFTTVPKGLYSSVERCRQHLPDQISIFERETGLTSFISFCQEEGALYPAPWAIHIDAFGDAKKMPFLNSVPLYAYPKNKSAPELYTDFALYFDSVNARLSWLFPRAQSPFEELAYFYYAKEQIPLQSLRVTRGLTLNQCEEAEMGWKDAFNKAGGTLVTLFCANSSSSPANYSLWSVFQETKTVHFSNAEEKFTTLTQCQNEKLALEEHYKKALGWPITGSICGLDDHNNVKLQFVEKG